MYLVIARNIRAQRILQLRRKQCSQYIRGTLFAWELARPWTPESRDKNETQGIVQSFVIFFISHHLWNSGNVTEREDRKPSFVLWILLHHLVLFPIFTYFLQWLFCFISSLLFLSWVLPIMRLLSPFFLLSVLPRANGIQMVVTRKMVPIITVTVIMQ